MHQNLFKQRNYATAIHQVVNLEDGIIGNEITKHVRIRFSRNGYDRGGNVCVVFNDTVNRYSYRFLMFTGNFIERVVLTVNLTGDSLTGESRKVFKADKRTGTVGKEQVAVELIRAAAEVGENFDGGELISSVVKTETVDRESFDELRKYIEAELIGKKAAQINGGDISPLPLIKDENRSPCAYCPFGGFCTNKDGFFGKREGGGR